MAFILSGDVCRYINSSVRSNISDRVAPGIWRYCYNDMEGSYLKRAEMDFSHGKLYDGLDKIVSHVVEAYRCGIADGNLGVLLQGIRGCGKSQACRLIMSELKDEFPIIIIDTYNEDIPSFLNNVSESIIFIDEFEKLFDDENASLLSVLDGGGSSSKNLILMTCNDTEVLDKSFFSRPGRIRYYYRMSGVSPETIQTFLEENLQIENKEEVVKFLVREFSISDEITLDILKCLATEVNTFHKDGNVEDVKGMLDYLNIFKFSRDFYVRIDFTFTDRDGDLRYDWNSTNTEIDNEIVLNFTDMQVVLNLEDAIYDNGVFTFNPDKVKVVHTFDKVSDLKITHAIAYAKD